MKRSGMEPSPGKSDKGDGVVIEMMKGNLSKGRQISAVTVPSDCVG